MSVNVETRVDAPGSAEFAAEAWELKERIREREGVLKQRRAFFVDAYRRATDHLLYEGDDLVGFASVRRDGYILFLAVAPERRGEGYGKRLVAAALQDHDSISCHARASNEGALSFYDHLGFETLRRINGYYEDGGDAYYLRLGDGASLREKFAEFFRRSVTGP
ncbi:GNAT family N-acetyltransferase [Halobellus captivus]|uniref:GNAT family N-acetyltransferase n=1 Tax=Halobellus captivus TaxID=2592614 RepID=UPI0011A92A42|nr:N-acetyltransferase [Halobellus captivus]